MLPATATHPVVWTLPATAAKGGFLSSELSFAPGDSVPTLLLKWRQLSLLRQVRATLLGVCVSACVEHHAANTWQRQHQT